ncbi:MULTISPECIES: SDR family NAD(P)-dependent oxidoreductase [Corynebacterium]|uniref:SDR family NAD(P)-dependent oxidoreductase n=1 Tax=Corynebacterium TaxID=1716 RepID=UPI000551FBE2|nr:MULTISPECIES: SDR family NAD(P)-dependent oxidoreductase [Corynebacterium]MCT1408992.1 SDR family NAD(P)-dependent oxidoreductase [Corynebacterium accolens]MDK4245042.1 SDR family NAD(P)-dependent oxidoreductase [Corynebacterium accolens]MDK4260718.1 SDR family NAD(P)-dependent oxidoreductase [Corynebacterium accolens]MDK4263372.1 SDR family NAD(P)-dependent oxidoreductase [Corynebacterium accolens]MDK4270357.1 SDR family NAD(P)-dependent oxidoreductase [Corynebacterium accolens]
MTSPYSAARTIVITGASSGIGAAAARQIHRTRPQDNLVIIGRNPDKTKAVAQEVGGQYFLADFESLAQVRQLADDLQQLERIDALGNNAGGIFDGPTITADGFERTWQVNVVAPFLLTSLLQDKLRESNATVVNTASLANMVMSNFDPADPNTLEHFSPERAYGNAKLADILLARFIDAHGINAVSFHPGVLATEFGKSSTGLTGKLYSGVIGKAFGTAEAGGENLAYFLTGTEGIHFQSGEYYNNRRTLGVQRPIAKNTSVAHRVFEDLGRRLNVEW